MRLLFCLPFALALAGCGGPIHYAFDPVQVQGRTVCVEMPTIANGDQRIDTAQTCEDIRKLANDYLQRYGYTTVQDAGGASLVLRAEISEFHLGSTAARVWVGAGQSWHDTSIRIHPAGGSDNTGRRKAEVDAGAYSNWKGDEPHRRAIVDEIAKMHVWVAEKYIGR